MPTFVRLTEYKNSEEKEKGFFEKKNRYEAKQEDFFKIPGSPIAYWVSDRVRKIFANEVQLSKLEPVKAGLTTGNNDKFLKFWYEVDNSNIDYKVNKKSNFIKKWYNRYIRTGSSAGIWSNEIFRSL